MAFQSVKGVEVHATEVGAVFLIADYFTVIYANQPLPLIFAWSEVKDIRESNHSFSLHMRGNESFLMKKAWFECGEDQLRCRAIMEAYAGLHGFSYARGGSLLPKKSLYGSYELPDKTVATISAYDPDDILEGAHAVQGYFYLRHLWILAFAVWTWLIIWIGDSIASDVGWVLALASSLGIAAGITLLLYALLRKLQNALIIAQLKNDPAAERPVIYVICRTGIAVVEECVGHYGELIPWSYFKGYMETQTMLVFTRYNKTVVRLPFRALSREQEAFIRKMLTSIGLPEKGR